MDRSDLESFRLEALAESARLLEAGKKSRAYVMDLLADYASRKARAMGYRERGVIDEALALEDDCDRLHMLLMGRGCGW